LSFQIFPVVTERFAAFKGQSGGSVRKNDAEYCRSNEKQASNAREAQRKKRSTKSVSSWDICALRLSRAARLAHITDKSHEPAGDGAVSAFRRRIASLHSSKADAAAGCADRYELVRKIRKAELAANMDAWAASPDAKLGTRRRG
jgi:hypothetical protein